MAKKATKKAARKAAPKSAGKKSSKKTASDTLPLEPLIPAEKRPLYLHNVSKSTANWTITGGGQKFRGCTPSGGASRVSVEHCKKFKVTFWGKDKAKKESASLGPDASAIYNGRGVAVTHPH